MCALDAHRMNCGSLFITRIQIHSHTYNIFQEINFSFNLSNEMGHRGILQINFTQNWRKQTWKSAESNFEFVWELRFRMKSIGNSNINAPIHLKRVSSALDLISNFPVEIEIQMHAQEYSFSKYMPFNCWNRIRIIKIVLSLYSQRLI